MSALPRSLNDDGETEETIVGPEIAIRGRIDGQEDLRVEGRIEGSISLTETLYVEPEGVVIAQVEARDVVISGIVIGDISAVNSVTLNRAAKHVGNISAPRVIIADGATFRGDVIMDGDDFQPATSTRTRATTTVPRQQLNRPSTRRRESSEPRVAAPARRAAPAPAAPARREAAPLRREAAPAPSRAAAPPSRRGKDEDDVTVVIKHAALRKGEAPPEEDDDKPRRRRAKKARTPARGRSKAGRKS